MKEFVEFYKKVVDTCNNSTCLFCPLNEIDKCGTCTSTMLSYFIEKNETIGRKIHDEFVKLYIDMIPNLITSSGKELYKEQLETLEKYCKNNSLEVE